MAETELSVVCKNCGAEVSPYVTECPYCGTRLRKRAPKLERRGDELLARETRGARRRRRAAERRARAPRLALAADRPYVTLAAILGPAALLVVQRAADLSLSSLGVIVAGVDTTDWWQYLAAPFVYDDLGYLFAIGLAMALFVPYLERRLGVVPTLILLIACGSLGALAAPGLDDAGLHQFGEPGREDRRADPGPFAQLRERQRAAPELPDQAQRPAAAEQVESVFHGFGRGH